MTKILSPSPFSPLPRISVRHSADASAELGTSLLPKNKKSSLSSFSSENSDRKGGTSNSSTPKLPSQFKLKVNQAREFVAEKVWQTRNAVRQIRHSAVDALVWGIEIGASLCIKVLPKSWADALTRRWIWKEPHTHAEGRSTAVNKPYPSTVVRGDEEFQAGLKSRDVSLEKDGTVLQCDFEDTTEHSTLRHGWGHMEDVAFVEARARGEDLSCVEPKGQLTLVKGTTLSSLTFKVEGQNPDPSGLQFNANLGHISVDDKLQILRSARSTNAKRVRELLSYGATQKLLEKNAASQLKDGKLHFKATILTCLDDSRQKNFGFRLLRLLNNKSKLEVEDEYLASLRQSIEEHFEGQATREETIAVEIDGVLQERTVVFHKPEVIEQAYSSQANNANNIRRARRNNQAAGQSVFSQLAETWANFDAEAESAKTSPVLQALAKRMQTAKTLQDKKQFLQDLKQTPQQFFNANGAQGAAPEELAQMPLAELVGQLRPPRG